MSPFFVYKYLDSEKGYHMIKKKEKRKKATFFPEDEFQVNQDHKP